MASFKSIDKTELLEFSKTAIKKGDILKHFNIGHNNYNLQQLNEFLLDNNLLNNFKTNWYKPKAIKIIKQYKYHCSFCNKGFNFKTKIINHYIDYHNLSHIEAIKQFYFYDKGIEFPKCPYCGKDVAICRHIARQTCSNPECRGKHNTKRQKEWYKNHPEEKEKRSRQRTEYLKNKQNFEKTAWGKRASDKMSFLEQWFVDNIIIPYNLGNKYDIVNELTVSHYFLDFAFTNIKLDVELDGRCHFNNGIERFQHDLDRDKFLENLNWKIYRISYKDVGQYPDKTINDFINYLENINFLEPKKLDTELFIENTEYKHKINEEKKIKKENRIKKINIEFENKYQQWENKLKNSNIDFSKFGWKTKCLEILQISPGKFKRFLNKTNFINNHNCYVNSNMRGSFGQKWIIDKIGNRKRVKI